MKTAQLLLVMEGFRDACEDLEFYRWWESLSAKEKCDTVRIVETYIESDTDCEWAEENFRHLYWNAKKNIKAGHLALKLLDEKDSK